ncbi:MAG: hypothetical protein LBM07_02590 [Culturomica sp.]|jgi:hypothetical protein|nr:hypothetical protein [Culturomica sp.]
MKSKGLKKIKVWRYLRELSIVVVGIAITLTVNNWLISRNEKQDMHLYLNSLKLELASNAVEIQSQIVILSEGVAYTRYLQSHDINALNPDSIAAYSSMAAWISRPTIKTSAFEMFKTSGAMRYLDHQRLTSIWETYSYLEKWQAFMKQYYDWKTDYALDIVKNKKQEPSLRYDFHIIGYSGDGLNFSTATLAKVENSLTQLDGN